VLEKIRVLCHFLLSLIHLYTFVVLGLMHWQQYGSYNESVVALLDPDMLFLRPITGHFKDVNVLTSRDWGNEKWDKVEKGRPAGQQYGLG
jgi:hypothetical protein